MVSFNIDGPARDKVMKMIQEKDRIESEIRDQTAILETNNIGLHEQLVDSEGFPRSDIDVYKVRHARHRIICLQNDHKNIMKMIEQGLAEVHSDLLRSNGEGPSTLSRAPTTFTDAHTANGNGSSVNDISSFSEPFATVSYVNNGSPADLAIQEKRKIALSALLLLITVCTIISDPNCDVYKGLFFGLTHFFVCVCYQLCFEYLKNSFGLCENDEILQFGSINRHNFDDMTQIYNIVAHSVGQRINVRVKRHHNVINLTVVPRPWSQPGLLGCHIQRINS